VELKPFVPSEVCLKCSGCCRFAEARSTWGPFFLFDEIRQLTEANIVPSCLFTHPDAVAGKGAWINLTQEDGHFFCPCLDVDRHTCRIYPHRPFDCRLYPFLLVREGTRILLAVDEKCPYVQEQGGSPAFSGHAATLTRLFCGPEGVAFLRAHPDIIQDYPSEYRVLQELSQA
jgi:Fe-S-cluster containining protein